MSVVEERNNSVWVIRDESVDKEEIERKLGWKKFKWVFEEVKGNFWQEFLGLGAGVTLFQGCRRDWKDKQCEVGLIVVDATSEEIDGLKELEKKIEKEYKKKVECNVYSDSEVAALVCRVKEDYIVAVAFDMWDFSRELRGKRWSRML